MSWFDLSHGLVPMLQADDVDLHQRYADIRSKLGFENPPRGIPLKAAIDPADFPVLLPLVNLVERLVADGEDRFRYKLIGSRNREAAGKDIKGLCLRDAIRPEYYQRIRGNYLQCMAAGKPVFDFFSVPHEKRGHITSERMYFPLSRDGVHVTEFLVLHGYEDVGLSTYRHAPLDNLISGYPIRPAPAPFAAPGDLSSIIR